MKKITSKDIETFINGLLGSDMPSRWAQKMSTEMQEFYASLPLIEETQEKK